MTGYRMHKPYLIIQSMPGYITCGWPPVLQVQVITHSSSISLRKIFGPSYENGSWRIKTNEELDKLIKHENIINFARAQRLGWYGHIERMQDIRIVKAKHTWKPISKRPMGRPKLQWEDDVKKNIQRLKVPNWKTLVQERGRWKEVIGKAKTLH